MPKTITKDAAREFVSNNHRAVLITRRGSGGLQSSPILLGIDAHDKLIISSRETAYKVRNLRRNPAATLCVVTEQWFGAPWMQIEGTAEIVSLPEAMEPLVDYYRRLSGEHPDWDDYRHAMQEQRRVLIRITMERLGPTRFG